MRHDKLIMQEAQHAVCRSYVILLQRMIRFFITLLYDCFIFPRFLTFSVVFSPKFFLHLRSSLYRIQRISVHGKTSPQPARISVTSSCVAAASAAAAAAVTDIGRKRARCCQQNAGPAGCTYCYRSISVLHSASDDSRATDVLSGRARNWWWWRMSPSFSFPLVPFLSS